MKPNQSLKIVVFGATSAIAQAVIKRLAKDGHEFFLVGRNESKLNAIANDTEVRTGNTPSYFAADLNDFAQHQAIIDAATAKLGKIDLAFIAHGTLSDQQACQQSASLTQQEFTTNCLSTISLCTYLANYFEQQRKGALAVISSVAGDRGRQSNYVYGAAKAALNAFLQGLRNRLNKANVHVLTIKPGFVDTPMTQNFDKGLLWATPERVANDIVKALYTKKSVLYTPPFLAVDYANH